MDIRSLAIYLFPAEVHTRKLLLRTRQVITVSLFITEPKSWTNTVKLGF